MTEKIPEFLMNHPILTAAWLAVVCAIGWTFKASATGGARLTPAQATRMINSEDAVVVDVRPDGEFRQGHILNARNIGIGRLGHPARKAGKVSATGQ